MKKYGDLNLKKIRDDYGLDFAHFTYLKGQRACEFSLLDFPARYWRDGKKPTKIETDVSVNCEMNGKPLDKNKIWYVLFRNVGGSGGTKTRGDDIKGDVYIDWNMPKATLRKVCKALKGQLGNEYSICEPKSPAYTIIIAMNWIPLAAINKNNYIIH